MIEKRKRIMDNFLWYKNSAFLNLIQTLRMLLNKYSFCEQKIGSRFGINRYLAFKLYRYLVEREGMNTMLH